MAYYRRKPGDRVFRVRRLKPWRVPVPKIPQKRVPKASPWTLVYGFAGMIGVGTLLLMLPISNNGGVATPLVDALFTATSAVCVTGLVVVDTLDYWNFFGQVVILVLIQLGGFGYMTITTIFLIALGRRIGLRERLLIGATTGLTGLGGAVRLIRNLVIFTLAAEITGMLIFYIYFSTGQPERMAIWTSLFQSVSAFNNAGFDIFGGFRSLTDYHNNYLVILTTSVLVILGGLSFLVIEDVFRTRRPERFSVDTKVVLSVSALLLGMGVVVVLATEYFNPETLAAMSTADKILNAFFQSVTSRTSGFSAITTGYMTDYALFFTMILMFIGGASGSTAGGIKVSTFGLIFATIWSTVRGREYPGAFGREFTTAQVHRALAVVMLSIGLVSVVVFFLTITEDADFLKLLFEAVSAFATVGLSTGVTTELSVAGRLIIIVTMFAGRLGPLTLILALVRAQRVILYRYPKEIVRVG